MTVDIILIRTRTIPEEVVAKEASRGEKGRELIQTRLQGLV
jgi:hypothetical protein